MTETELQASIIAAAERLGWLVYHAERSARKITRRSGESMWIRNQPRTGKGFPDLVLLHPDRRMLVFAELKGDVGTRGGSARVALSEEQTTWIRGLASVFQPDDATLDSGAAWPQAFVTVWRPKDYDRILYLLAHGTYRERDSHG